jgi:surface protein
MSLSLGSTTIGSLYLGATKIGEAYLGSTKVFSAGAPALAPRSMRFDFKYDHFDPLTGLADLSADGLIWTHVSGDGYDFHYDNANWGYRTLRSGNGGLFNVYAIKSGSGWTYPVAQHQFDVLDMDLTGVTTVSYLFNSARQVQNILSIRNTSSVTDFNTFLYHARTIVIPSIPLFDTSSATDMSRMFFGCVHLTSIPLFNTGNVTNVKEMFSGCSKVESGALALYQQMSTQTTPPSSHTNCFKNCGKNTTTGAAELAQIPTSWGGTMS